MDFFSLRMNLKAEHSGQQFLAYIYEAGSDVHRGTARTDLRYSPDGKVMMLTVSSSGQTKRKELLDNTGAELASGIARYIVEVREKEIAMELAGKEYPFSSDEEKQAVEECVSGLLAGSDRDVRSARERRMKGIQAKLAQYLQTNSYLDLDGFIRFRLQEYRNQLREEIDTAMEEYLLDQQYEQFIRLLQSFVKFQEPLTPLVHLMHKGEQDFSVLNEQFTKINATVPGGVVAQMADQEMELEDRVVSTLISLSPCRILIHTRQPESLIISTIRRIFGERVQLCLHCPHCHPFHMEPRRKDQGI